uniref:ATP synthase delta chainic-like n=1 Tax=Rhizophora mucronata TaxID=61149 RepID=A0A2P2L300_RHIMU
MAAALQSATVSIQSKIPPSARLPSRIVSFQKPLSLSFSANFPSINLTSSAASIHRALRRRGGGASGAKMSATVAGSYATALADVAKSNNTLDATYADTEKIEKLFSDPQVLDFFVNPTIDPEKKIEVVDEMAKSSELQLHTANFLNILIEAKRMDLIKEIVKEFESVYNQLTDTEMAVVSSVVNLESQHLAQIAKQVQKLTGAKNVRVKTAIDPSLVAGFTVRYGSSGSKLIDMSVKKQLDDIAAQLDLGDIQLAR